jgi:transposase
MDTATTSAVTTTTAGPILALDLGKFKSVACTYDTASALARFHTIPTSRQDLRKLFKLTQPTVVVFEACALAGWVLDLCRDCGLTPKVANTASEAWKLKHSKRKTDKDDALRLAQLEALGQLPTVALPPKQNREWRALIAARQLVVGRRVAMQNRIRSLLVSQGLPAPRGHRAWTVVGLQGITQHAKTLADCADDELWRGLLDLALAELRQTRQRLDLVEDKLDALSARDEGVRILETIPGVGPLTAEAVAAHLHDPARFDNGKQVSAYGGLVPRQYQSGETDHRGRITRRGPALLRKLLVECAWAMLRYNAWARAVYARLSHGGKTHKKQAIVAVARKLLVRCWAMLRDGLPWRSDPTPQPAAAPA